MKPLFKYFKYNFRLNTDTITNNGRTPIINETDIIDKQ